MVNLVLPQSNPEPEPEPKKVHKKRNLRQVIIYLFYLALIALALAGLWYAQTQGLFAALRTQTSSQTPTATDSAGPDIGAPVEFKYPGTLEEIAAEALFIDNGNIAWLKKDGSITKLTTLSKGTELTANSPTYESPFFVDGSSWGVRKCTITPEGDFTCGLYQFDMNSKLTATFNEKKGKKGESITSYMPIGISNNGNLVAFVASVSKTDLSSAIAEVHVFDRTVNKDTLVLSVECKDFGGRGGGLDDSVRLQFSPSSDKLLYINTINDQCRTGDLETIYVFDLKTNAILYSSGKDKTTRYSQAAWLDNGSFYYKDHGKILVILSYDLAKKESLVQITETGPWYSFLSFGAKAIYEIQPEEVDKTSKPQTKIISGGKNASTGADYFSPSEWLSDNFIYGLVVGYCGGPCDSPDGLGYDGDAIFELSSGKLYRVKGADKVTGFIYDIRI